MSLNKIQINGSTAVNTGIVYDISKETNQRYNSLSDALGPNGDNVPLEVREGGMSVKYIQIDNNKYMQFRYMKTDVTTVSRFTNIENW